MDLSVGQRLRSVSSAQSVGVGRATMKIVTVILIGVGVLTLVALGLRLWLHGVLPIVF